MSMPASRRGRRRLGLVASFAAALGLFLVLGAGNAAASVSCVFNLSLAQVSIVVSGDSLTAPTNNTITVRKGFQDAILVNGAPCLDGGTGLAATTLNTRQINVLESAAFPADGDDTLVIDERSGRFVPGAPGAITSGDLNAANFNAAVSDGNGLNEIEWFVGWTVVGGGTDDLVYFDTDTEGAVVLGNNGGGPPTTFWDGTLPFVPAGAAAPTVTAITEGDLLININAFPGDDDADIWAPDAQGDVDLITINAGGGDDFVSGKGGDGTGGILDDAYPLVINGGGGNDSCQGGLGSDTFTGCEFVDGNGPAVPVVFPFQDDLLAEWGLDFFIGDLVDFSDLAGPLSVTIQADGSLVVSGTSGTFVGVEHVAGSQGNDTITGNGFPNVLAGCGGNDTIHGGDEPAGTGGDFVDGDNQSGVCSVFQASQAGNDALDGGQGNDAVVGGPGNDTLNENTGVTSSTLLNGADALDGGEGVDTVDYGERTTRVVVYLGLISTFNDGADLNADGLTNEFDDVFFTTENAITGSGNDIVSANFVNNRANNVFTDNDGNDCLEGGPGNDTFNQGSSPQGADVQIGNTGADLSDYSGRSGAVQVALDGVANDGDIASNEGDNVGGLSVSCRPLTLQVNPPQSVIDFFDGDAFNFIQNVFSFLDAPVAGPTPSTILSPGDNFQFDLCNNLLRAPQGQTPLGACPGETLGGDQAPLVNVDVENVNGGSGDDILTGNLVGNVLNGNAGNDTIRGGGSVDQLNGGAGDDLINPGDGNDAVDGGEGTNTVDYAGAGAGGVGVQVNLTRGVATGSGNDTLKNIQNTNGSSFDDALNGNEQNNVLNGFGGEDAISGNAGDDTINGGAGGDQLSGQTGNDAIRGAGGNDSIQGGAGDDNLQGGNGKDTILGQKGNDKLYGNAQPDFLNGGPGRDICKPGSPGLARGDVVVNCES